MYSIDNMERISLSTDVVMDMIKLYQFKGKEFYYKKVFSDDMKIFSKQVVETETFFSSKLLNIEISENRMRLITKKESISIKNKNEQLVKNIKRIFRRLHDKINDFDYNHNQIHELARFIYNGVEEIGFDTVQITERNTLIPEKRKIKKQDELIKYLDKFNKMLQSKEYELTLLITNFYVDFINIKPFTKNNEVVGLFLLYIVLFKEGFEIVRFKSFFELLLNRYEGFKNGVLQANFNWEEGYSQTLPLQRIIIRILLDSYATVDDKLRDYQYDLEQNKTDTIENAIMKMPDLFTKDELRNKNPLVSDSTINRTLKRLRDEGKIRPLGVGRSAKWQKLVINEKFNYKQIGLFQDEE